MASNLNLADLTVEEREKHMEELRRECIEFRTEKEAVWLDLWRAWRNVKDTETVTQTKFFSPYLWSAIQSIVSIIEPIFFADDPTFELLDPKEENYDRNRMQEKILTAQVRYRSNFREAWTRILTEAALFSVSYPYTFWKTLHRVVGPFHNPVLDAFGNPVEEQGRVVTEPEFRRLRVVHSPWLEYVSLWDSFIHPDGRRGFSVRDVTGYELIETTFGANPIYDPDRVVRMIRLASLNMDGKRDGRDDFVPGDDEQVMRDILALEAGTEAGQRHEMWKAGLYADVLATTFPIYHYADDNYSGSYALNKDGRFMELRFYAGASPDGTSNRLRCAPFHAPGEVFPVGPAEIAWPLIKFHSRFMQLGTDGALLTVYPQWLVSDTYDRQVGEVLTGPGAVNVVPTTGGKLEEHIQRQDMPQTWVNAINFMEMLEKQLDGTFAQDDPSRGRLPGSHRTAFATRAALQFTQSRLQVMADRIANDFGVPLARKWMCMNSMHLSPDDLREYLGVEAEGLVLPTPEEIVQSLTIVFKGSVTGANKQEMLQRYPALAQTYFSAIPLLRLPFVQEFMRQWMELEGMRAITKQFPAADGTIPTEFQAMIGKPLIGGGLPRSPTDVGRMLAGEGGAAAGSSPEGGVSGEFGG